MKNFVAGAWIEKTKKIEVTNPFNNSVIDTVPKADAGDLEKALAFAERGAKVMAKLSSYDRWKILRKAADPLSSVASHRLRRIAKQFNSNKDCRNTEFGNASSASAAAFDSAYARSRT